MHATHEGMGGLRFAGRELEFLAPCGNCRRPAENLFHLLDHAGGGAVSTPAAIRENITW